MYSDPVCQIMVDTPEFNRSVLTCAMSDMTWSNRLLGNMCFAATYSNSDSVRAHAKKLVEEYASHTPTTTGSKADEVAGRTKRRRRRMKGKQHSCLVS